MKFRSEGLDMELTLYLEDVSLIVCGISLIISFVSLVMCKLLSDERKVKVLEYVVVVFGVVGLTMLYTVCKL